MECLEVENKFSDTEYPTIKSHKKEVNFRDKEHTTAECQEIDTKCTIKVYICDQCMKTFKNRSGIMYHTSRGCVTFSRSKKKSSITCPEPECNTANLATLNSLRTHLAMVHNKYIKRSHAQFRTFKEFEEWKINIQKQGHCFYARNKQVKKKNGIYIYYWCNRSGSYTYRGKQVRFVEYSDSVKIGRCCPSEMVAHFKDDAVHVTYFETHYGHDLKSKFIKCATLINRSLSTCQSSKLVNKKNKKSSHSQHPQSSITLNEDMTEFLKTDDSIEEENCDESVDSIVPTVSSVPAMVTTTIADTKNANGTIDELAMDGSVENIGTAVSVTLWDNQITGDINSKCLFLDELNADGKTLNTVLYPHCVIGQIDNSAYANEIPTDVSTGVCISNYCTSTVIAKTTDIISELSPFFATTKSADNEIIFAGNVIIRDNHNDNEDSSNRALHSTRKNCVKDETIIDCDVDDKNGNYENKVIYIEDFCDSCMSVTDSADKDNPSYPDNVINESYRSVNCIVESDKINPSRNNDDYNISHCEDANNNCDGSNINVENHVNDDDSRIYECTDVVVNACNSNNDANNNHHTHNELNDVNNSSSSSSSSNFVDPSCRFSDKQSVINRIERLLTLYQSIEINRDVNVYISNSLNDLISICNDKSCHKVDKEMV